MVGEHLLDATTQLPPVVQDEGVSIAVVLFIYQELINSHYHTDFFIQVRRLPLLFCKNFMPIAISELRLRSIPCCPYALLDPLEHHLGIQLLWSGVIWTTMVARGGQKN